MLIAALLYAGSLSAEDVEAQTTTEAEKLFALTVEPLLRHKCLGCHGDDPDQIESGFDVRDRRAMLRGGDVFDREVLVPGDSAISVLLRMVKREEEGYAMPPKEAERLTDAEIWAIRDWIDGGAPWPDSQRRAQIYEDYAEGIVWPTSGGQSQAWTQRKYSVDDLWAYRPVPSVEVPEDTNPVDYLIGRELDRKRIVGMAEADRRTLIRRATFDLLGLPPTPEEVRAFVGDPRSTSEAMSDVIERLLASPHYGEQWGRHWLDVVRYADSSGFANDWERPNAWRYRDYVIRAFNDDKPYRQFVREQIAGDELYKQRLSAGDDADPELLIAAGFLRMGPWEHTAMSVAKVTRQQFLDDITDSVGQVFMAHALQCARCHDHKFDPVPTRDYYAIQALFATTQFAEVEAEWLKEENLQGMDEDRRYLEKQIAANDVVLKNVVEAKAQAEKNWFKQQGLPYESSREAKRAGAPPEHIPPITELIGPNVFGQERLGRKWQVRLPWELDRYRPIAFTVYNGKTHFGPHSRRLLKPVDPMAQGTLEVTHILTGGDPFAPADEVDPGLLSAVRSSQGYHVPNAATGRRLAFADWLTQPEHPLTARVMVNRIWQHHFGRALAPNPNNFGTTGKKPTHPQLLDWLAKRFVSSGWSVKQLHRTIMNSATYRRGSLSEVRQMTAPDGWRLPTREDRDSYAYFLPRRLAAEEIRDAMLRTTDELNPAIGGIPARPDMNLEAALQPRMIMGTFAPSYVPNPKPEQRNRRSIYALRLRGQRDPFMETFNQPGSEKSCELRDRSLVSPQALTLLNSAETYDRALALAQRLMRETDDDEAAVERLFWLAYSRSPTSQESTMTLEHWQSMTARQAERKPQPTEFPTEIVRTATEENTGEPFQFTERLFGYEDYVSDLQAYQVDAKTRALGDVCLAILNSNEFVFVY